MFKFLLARQVSSSGFGLFGGGAVGGAGSLTTEAYFFATNNRVAGTNLGTARSGLAAAGNSSIGVFGGGGFSSATDIYTFATNGRIGGTSLSVNTTRTAVGNSTVGVFGGGYTYETLVGTDVYTYATNGRVAETDLNTARHYSAACSSTPGHL